MECNFLLVTSRYGTLPSPRLSVMVTFSDGDAGRAAALLAAFSRAVENASHVDHIFTNLPMAELRDFQHHSHTVGTIGEKSVPSDHIPVRLAIGSLPNWTNGLPCHPLFVNLLDVEHRNMMSTLSSHSTSSETFHAVLARRPSRPFWSIPRLPLESSCWSHLLTAAPCSSPSLLKYIEGHIFRAPETLRSLTLCNCDCKVITAAMCFGLRRYSIECMVRCNSIIAQRGLPALL